MSTHEKILRELDEAEHKALDSLARYKFQMFGYWAAIWVHLNRLSGENRPSPFTRLVREARAMRSDVKSPHVENVADMQAEISKCEAETNHAQVAKTGFCRCTAVMYGG